MIKHYFKSALRLIRRNLLFSAINMLGFILGITAAFLIYLWIVDELTYEDFNKHRDSIYRVVKVSAEPGGSLKESPATVAPLAEAFRNEFPSVEKACFIKYESKRILEYQERFAEGNWLYVDSVFFEMFTFPVIEGNPAQIKQDPGNIVLSEPSSKKLFGKESPIGKQLLYEIFGKKHWFTVVAVVKVPRKSHIQFDFAASIKAYPVPVTWHFNEHIINYVQLKDQASMPYADRKGMSGLLAKHTGTKDMLYFQPLTDIHLRTTFADPKVENHGSINQIYLFAALAILIIFMGAFNFMTLSTAQASLRYKEIGVRKVTGAKRKKLISQFLSESSVQAFISLVLALALTELLLPLFNQFAGKDISLQLSWQVILFVLFGILGIGCLAGSYPAFYLSTINPLLAFKGGIKTGKKGRFIKILVCVQFFIAIVLILCTSVVFKQLNYLQNQDLGYEKENIISIQTNLWYDVDVFKKEILKNPRVISVSMGAHIADYLKGYKWENELIGWDTADGRTDSLKMTTMWTDGEFFPTFGIQLVKGKFYETDFSGYWSGEYTHPTIINETAWKMMKVEDPIGLNLYGINNQWTKGVIVGVVKDFNFQSLRENIKPLFIRYSPESIGTLHIRIAPEDIPGTLKFLAEKYDKMHPTWSREFNYTFFTDELAKNYARERQQGHIFLIFTILAIFIAMMGVFGLVSLATRQRTKEIGVRKVVGAHSDKIVRMFCLEYLRWLAIAFVIACPSAYLFMHNWLDTFAYRTTVSWWLFPLAGLIVLAITVATVIAQTYRTASRNPVTSLRYE